MSKECAHEWVSMRCVKCGASCDGKADTGKLKWHLLPWEPLKDVVKVMMNGQNKYKAWSWCKVPNPQERYWNAAFRHLMARYEGITRDEEDGLHPLAHLICDALFIMAFDKVLEAKPIGPLLEELIQRDDSQNQE